MKAIIQKWQNNECDESVTITLANGATIHINWVPDAPFGIDVGVYKWDVDDNEDEPVTMVSFPAEQGTPRFEVIT